MVNANAAYGRHLLLKFMLLALLLTLVFRANAFSSLKLKLKYREIRCYILLGCMSSAQKSACEPLQTDASDLSRPKLYRQLGRLN
jgi:hypothetical protein